MKYDIFAVKKALANSFRNALPSMDGSETNVSMDVPKDDGHGDFSTPVAMILGKKLRQAPLAMAQRIVEKVSFEENLISGIEVAPPGFINITLHPEVFHSSLEYALNLGDSFGCNEEEAGQKVLLEFVSANPTGPLNVVNARAAALGDSIANLLTASGATAVREYYVNDTGVQARLFGESLMAACQRVEGKDAPAPEGGYQGAYMEDLAREYLKLESPPEPGEWGMDQVLKWHQKSLLDYGVNFDHWFSEKKELHNSGLVSKAIENIQEAGLTFKKDGALWIKVSEYGSPKDEVLVKSDGLPAYFAADIAYHKGKFERGFNRIVDIWGPDHHGHIQRMKSALSAMGLPVEKFMVLIAQQVNLLEGGEKVKMSKREGKFVTMDELLSKVGKDAARFFFVMRSANSHLDFDIEVAQKHTEENPVFYIQYAHARINSLLKKCAENNLFPAQRSKEFQFLNEPEAKLLLKEIMEYPQWVVESGRAYEPHRLVIYLQKLAADFHYFYSKHRILDAPKEIAQARLGLSLGVKIVLRNALTLLGVSSPEQM